MYGPENLVNPPEEIILITPSDSVVISPPLRAISFGTAGTLAVRGVKGNGSTPTGTTTIPDGSLATGLQHAMRIDKVLSTGTTVTEIVGYR